MSQRSDAPIVLVGGGGHAAVCLDVFRSGGATVLGYLAPVAGHLDEEHLGSDGDLERFASMDVQLFVAVGDNRRRLELIERAESAGATLATGISGAATVSPSARIGAGSVLMPGAIVNARSVLGRGVIVNTAATIDHDAVIGDAVHVAPGCHLAGDVTVGDGAFLGVGTCVVPQRTIGAWATVGAGAVVVRDLPGGRTSRGVPARPDPG